MQKFREPAPTAIGTCACLHPNQTKNTPKDHRRNRVTIRMSFRKYRLDTER